MKAPVEELADVCPACAVASVKPQMFPVPNGQPLFHATAPETIRDWDWDRVHYDRHGLIANPVAIYPVRIQIGERETYHFVAYPD